MNMGTERVNCLDYFKKMMRVELILQVRYWIYLVRSSKSLINM